MRADPTLRRIESMRFMRAASLALIGAAILSHPEGALAQEESTATPSASATSEATAAATDDSPATPPPIERIWEEGLEAGLAAAQSSGKPAFVVAGGVDCPWCRRLEEELALASLTEELDHWTLVHVDVDEAPGDARRLGVGPIPALRLLRPTGAGIASCEGFLEAGALRKWLQEHRGAAGAGADPSLIAQGEPDATAVLRLVGFLTDRDPLLRDAAIKRLATAPRLAAPALLERLGEEKLAGRLAALEVFALWDAPIEALDPWRPETIDQGALKTLERWADERSPADVDADGPAFDEDDVAEVEREIERLLKLDLSAGAPLRARLARYGSAALPVVLVRLETAATNEERQKLLALRYRLVASDSLALRDPGSLLSLASGDALARRQGAETLTSLAGPGDQGLLLEMFGDPDPLIRETALRGIERLDDGAASKSLVGLLQDPEPNVRAAVLKRLSETGSADLVGDVADYVRTESDPDLLVHAVRYLQQTGSPKAVEAVAPLLEHASWQVRAQAVEALGLLADSNFQSQHPARAADVVAALIERLQDEDPFVVSRAATALQESGEALAIEPTLDAAERFPDIAPAIIASSAANHPGSPLVLKRLSAFAKHERAAIRTAACVALLESSDVAGRELALAALSDADSTVRREVAAAIALRLDEKLQEVRGEMITLRFGSGEPVTAPPPDWDAKLQSLADSSWMKTWIAAEDSLLKMLESDDPRERVAAAAALARLGHFDEAEPVLSREVASSEQALEAAAGALPWAPQERRDGFFQTLFDAATNERQRTLLVHTAGQIYDAGTPDLLWRLTERENLTLEFAGALFDAIGSAYLGEIFRHEQADPATLRTIADAAGDRLDGSPYRRLIALCVLAHADAREAQDAARQIADDPSAPESLRTDAFQILLALQTDAAEREALVQEGFAGTDAGKRRVSLRTFVTGGDELAYLHEYAFRVPQSQSSYDAYSSREPGPIVPKAPEGATVESLRSFQPANDEERAHVAYLLALLGERDGLDALLSLRDSTGGMDSPIVTPEMAYRAIARLDASDRIDTLREISASLDSYSMPEFYWTVRIMTGEPALRLRKEIRDKYGVDALR